MGTLSSLFTLARAGWVFTREGVIATLPAELFPSTIYTIAKILTRKRSVSTQQSQRLSRALRRLGPSWVKLGQFLATRPDIVGMQIAKDLEILQDRMHPFPLEQARLTITQSLGRPLEDMFSSFGESVAAASIAQVHRAKLKNADESVAVKVIRPGIRHRFAKDLQTFFTVARLQEKFIPASRRLRPVAVTTMLSQSARIEMDLRLEAAALSEMAENITNDPGFRVPKVYWELTGRDCLTMEWIEGTKLGETKALIAAGHDLSALARTLMQSFLRHALRDGFFHADMHPGNLFVADNGDIIAVDLGIMGRLGRKERRFLAEILLGFITGDYLRVARVHFEAGYVPDHYDIASFAQAIRAIGEPIHGHSADTLSIAKLLTLLFEITQLFDMQTRTELVLLQKTMVVVEGVCRKLDPAFNMWQVSEPVVHEWMNHNVGPVGKLMEAAEGLKAAGKLIRDLPKMADMSRRLSDAMEDMISKGIRLDSSTIEAIGKARARYSKSNYYALWAISLIAMIAILVTIR